MEMYFIIRKLSKKGCNPRKDGVQPFMSFHAIDKAFKTIIP